VSGNSCHCVAIEFAGPELPGKKKSMSLVLKTSTITDEVALRKLKVYVKKFDTWGIASWPSIDN
jgi:hypothetical protein